MSSEHPSLARRRISNLALLACFTLPPALWIMQLVANYALEHEYRFHYLQRLRGRMQGAQLSEMVEQLHELSLRDPLTGVANRRALDELLQELCARGDRFAVIIVDVDAFKAFNDTYGHQVGDDCLRRISAMMRASLRFPTDRVARMVRELEKAAEA